MLQSDVYTSPNPNTGILFEVANGARVLPIIVITCQNDVHSSAILYKATLSDQQMDGMGGYLLVRIDPVGRYFMQGAPLATDFALVLVARRVINACSHLLYRDSVICKGF